jgi:hypothetical protein
MKLPAILLALLPPLLLLLSLPSPTLAAADILDILLATGTHSSSAALPRPTPHDNNTSSPLP